MKRVLEGIAPEKVFYYFEEICNIPHGSYNVTAISNYLVNFAKERNLEVIQDKEENVVIKKPASKGMEQAPTIIIQGHMDMVCEKNSGVTHDFLKDGLKLKVEGDDITASGTTLGGDDGIAVAYALAILDDDSIVHPALEILITTQEEVGMEGAFGFDVSTLSGKYILNLDSEEEGTMLTSCAGGITANIDFPIQFEDAPKGDFICHEIHIHGLKGGHSGADIHFGRANANILMGQLLYVFQSTGVEYSLVKVEGGLKNNAITREANAVLFLRESQKELVGIVLKDFVTRVAQEFAERDKDIQVDVMPVGKQYGKVMTKPCQMVYAAVAAHMVDGVCAMSEDVKGLVETSTNLGVVTTNEDTIKMDFLVRSSKDAEIDRVVEVLHFVADKATAEAKNRNPEYTNDFCPVLTTSNRYPGWEYKKNSSLQKLVADVYEKQYQQPMQVTAIHAGLECGIFAGQGDFDIVSLGPDILDIHTPAETLKIGSTKRTYELVCEILKRAGELE